MQEERHTAGLNLAGEALSEPAGPAVADLPASTSAAAPTLSEAELAARLGPYSDALEQIGAAAKLHHLMARSAGFALSLFAAAYVYVVWQDDPLVSTLLPFALIAALLLLLGGPLWTRLVGSPQQQLERNHANQLETAQLARKLALGEFDNELPREMTPWLLRWMVPRNPGREPLPIMRNIAANLAWFTGPPRRHIRPTWQVMLAFMPLAAMFLLPLFINRAFGFSGSIFDSEFFLFSLLFPVGLSLLTLSQDIATRLLSYKLLREHFAKTLEQFNAAAERRQEPEAEVDLSTAEGMNRVTQLHLIVNQLEQDITPQSFMVQAFASIPLTMFFLPLVFVFLLPSGRSQHLPWHYYIIAGLLSAAGWWLLQRWGKSYARQLSRRLDDSDLSLRIASGELIKDDIFERTPQLLKSFLNLPKKPKGYADALREVLWRVAFNLEYYLRRPKRYIRGIWIAVPLMFLAFPLFGPLSMLPLYLMGTGGEEYRLAAFIAQFAGAGAVSLLLGVEGTKIHSWCEEFTAYLRRHLDE